MWLACTVSWLLDQTTRDQIVFRGGKSENGKRNADTNTNENSNANTNTNAHTNTNSWRAQSVDCLIKRPETNTNTNGWQAQQLPFSSTLLRPHFSEKIARKKTNQRNCASSLSPLCLQDHNKGQYTFWFCLCFICLIFFCFVFFVGQERDPNRGQFVVLICLCVLFCFVSFVGQERDPNQGQCAVCGVVANLCFGRHLCLLWHLLHICLCDLPHLCFYRHLRYIYLYHLCHICHLFLICLFVFMS